MKRYLTDTKVTEHAGTMYREVTVTFVLPYDDKRKNLLDLARTLEDAEWFDQSAELRWLANQSDGGTT